MLRVSRSRIQQRSEPVARFPFAMPPASEYHASPGGSENDTFCTNSSRPQWVPAGGPREHNKTMGLRMTFGQNGMERARSLKRIPSFELIASLTPFELFKAATAGAWTELCRQLDGHRERVQARRNAATFSGKQQPRAELHPGRFAAGSLIFTCIVFLAAAYPFILPHLFLAFSLIALPLRAYDFTIVNPRNTFFLLDFCYFVNIGVVIFLLLPAEGRDPRVEAALYALAEGPVAGAIAAWQTAWVFSSIEHTISVLIHLMPGLAMYAHRHLPRVTTWNQIMSCIPKLQRAATALNFSGCITDKGPLSSGLPLEWKTCMMWLVLAPMLFYGVWQLIYFLAVQVLFENTIRKDNLDTSYKCLARRAARADNLLARIVLQGKIRRRVFLFGILQAAYTAAALLVLAVPTYYSWHLAFLWQVTKFVLPVHYGARHLFSRLLKAAISDAVRQREDHNQASAGGNEEEVESRLRRNTSNIGNQKKRQPSLSKRK